MEFGASAEDQATVQSVLDRHDLGVEVHSSYVRASAEQLPWIVFISGPIGIFLSSFAKNLGVASSDGVRRFVTDLYEDRRKVRGRQAGTVGLIDGTLDVALRADLPVAAYEQLPRLQAYTRVDPSQTGNFANWNGELNCWQVGYLDEHGNNHRIDITD